MNKTGSSLAALAWLNLAIVFAVELAGLAALGVWGAQAVPSAFGRWALAIAVPLLAAALWAVCCAPRAVVPLPHTAVVAIKVALLGLATWALASAGHPLLAAVLALVALGTATAARLLLDPRSASASD